MTSARVTFLALAVLASVLPSFALPSGSPFAVFTDGTTRRTSSLAAQSALACFHNDDCSAVPLNGRRSCIAGSCRLQCDAGFERSGSECHRSAGQICSKGYRLYDGSCLSAPATPISTRRCSSSLQCPTELGGHSLGLAHPFCEQPEDGSAGTCTVRCYLGAVYSPTSRSCVPAPAHARRAISSTTTGGPGSSCILNSQCANGALGSNLVGICQTATGICAVVCASGFINQGGFCIAIAITLKPASCANVTCKPVSGGTSSCRNGVCSYQCNNPLATVNCSGATCTCQAIFSDPLNCGPLHLVCPGVGSAYASLTGRRPTCIAGVCGLA